MSNISSSTNKIDVLFPIAGQDNPSQGFRDNFANIKAALTTADAEVSTLQNIAVTTTADSNMLNHQISNIVLADNGVKAINTQTVVLPIIPILFSEGSYREFTISAGVTFSIAFDNRPDNVYSVLRIVVHTSNDASVTFTVPSPTTTALVGDFGNSYGMINGNTMVWDVWTSNANQSVYLTKVGDTFTVL